VVQPSVGPIATIIQSPLDAVTGSVQAFRASVMPGRFGPVGTPIEPAVDALAPVIQAGVYPVAAIVEALVDAIATPVQPLPDTVSLVGHRRAA
jgi:uncharacterized protein YqgV (UPF0045/DUF77 family)